MPVALSDDEIQTLVSALKHLHLISPLTEEEHNVQDKLQNVLDRK